MTRFKTVKSAISYCGLCGDEQSSAGKIQRTPLSKQRNKHLQKHYLPKTHSGECRLWQKIIVERSIHPAAVDEHKMRSTAWEVATLINRANTLPSSRQAWREGTAR